MPRLLIPMPAHAPCRRVCQAPVPLRARVRALQYMSWRQTASVRWFCSLTSQSGNDRQYYQPPPWRARSKPCQDAVYRPLRYSPSRHEVHDSRVLHAAGVGEHHGVDRIDRLGRNRGLGSAKSKTSSAKIALIDFARAGAPNTFVHFRPPEGRSIPVLLKTKPQLYWLGLIFRSYNTGKQALYPGGPVDAYFRPS